MYYLIYFYCKALQKCGSPYPIYAVILMLSSLEMSTLVSVIIILNIKTGLLLPRAIYFVILILASLYTGYLINRRKWSIVRKYNFQEIYWEQMLIAAIFYIFVFVGQILLAIEIGFFLRNRNF